MCEGMVAPAAAYTNVVPSMVDSSNRTFYTVLPRLRSDSNSTFLPTLHLC